MKKISVIFLKILQNKTLLSLIDILRRLSRDKVAFFSLILLCSLYFIAIFADFLSPYPKEYSIRDLTYAPPSQIYVQDVNGNLSWPYTYNYERTFNKVTLSQEYKQDRTNKYYLQFFTASKPYHFLGVIPSSIRFIGVKEGGHLFLLGTDINGRDVFSRLLFGGQISLTIGFFALFISIPIGCLYGGISGYFGGHVDNMMMRFAEVVMSIPYIYLLITLSLLLPDHISSRERFAFITIILAFVGWAGLSRVVRGMVLSIKNFEFVEASESMAAHPLWTISKHIIPQAASYIIVSITLSVPGYILAESALSFLGLGIQQPDASWGNMLKEAQQYTNIISRPWLLLPGFLIFFAVLSFNIIGDTTRDILDPKSKIRVR